MPRTARRKSSTGIYHVMLRGINKQKIFLDNEDYERFLHTLNKFKDISGYSIYAYCLMNNHIHLLLKVGKEDLSNTFKRIGASFVYFYNRKYDRVGHLFQDRYRSEPVEDDKYFLAVIRYIHQNPLKAGLVKDIGKYNWSSYSEYMGKNELCDTEYALEIFSSNTKTAIKLFKDFNQLDSSDSYLEDVPKRVNDQNAVKLIKQVSNVDDISIIKSFDKEKRNAIIKQLKEKNLSIRQLERLLGISFSKIRAIK